MLGIVKNTAAGTPFLETNTRHTGVVNIALTCYDLRRTLADASGLFS